MQISNYLLLKSRKLNKLYDNWIPVRLYRLIQDATVYLDSKSLYRLSDNQIRVDDTDNFKKIGNFSIGASYSIDEQMDNGYLMLPSSSHIIMSKGFSLDIRNGATFFIDFGIREQVTGYWIRPFFIGSIDKGMGDYRATHVRLEASTSATNINISFVNFGKVAGISLRTSWDYLYNSGEPKHISLMIVFTPIGEGILKAEAFKNNKKLGEIEFETSGITNPVFNYFANLGNRGHDKTRIDFGAMGALPRPLTEQQRNQLYKEQRRLRPVEE